ncbi:MAG: helicase [Bacteroidetes bacterium CG2_30_32_10]|nr:MAG: helicase [Bacteroidetes bacterium CG2_30_32_10]
MEYRQNEQLQLAYEFIQFTNKNIFLTGKAGTGKTTFLHNLRKTTAKRMVVVAPTGVAAINAGGVTIHSFFQLSFAPTIPEIALPKNNVPKKTEFNRKMNRDKIRLIKCIDLLVIDEISMVRADILDAVDEVLRKYRNRYKPFGGVQLLMIGDLHQLSPVIKDAEWNILKDYYKSVYFFDSLALKNTNPICIELKEIFRQSDAIFIDLLNKVRKNTIDPQTIKELNARYIPNFKPKDDEGYITLTTHNANAFETNQAKLKQIKSNSHYFSAEIKGDFPTFNFPTEEKLELKVNAQVMFIKNDLSAEKNFYNGKIGKITRIEEDVIYVKCPSETMEIAVSPVEWENVKYALNDETKEIKEEIVGNFIQYPLKLAWAITIHKSQGLTFDKVIIDANAAFAFGQVYVALSRCRTFDGIVLSTPISVSGIKTDSLVINYSQEAQENEPGPEKLLESKTLFQQELIFELFDFKLTKYRFDSLLKLVTENKNILETFLINELQTKRNDCELEIIQVADKFKMQLQTLMNQSKLPEETPEVQQRIAKACAYFADKIEKHLYVFTQNIIIETDNKAVKKLLIDDIENLQREAFIKSACIKSCLQGFETIKYVKNRSNADVDFRFLNVQKSKLPNPTVVNKNIQHPALYTTLKNWCNNRAEEKDLPTFMILPHKSILELVKNLPTSRKELKAIKGIGQAKINQFGDDIVSMIKEYCEDNHITPAQIDVKEEKIKKKKEIGESKKLSFDLYKSGKTLAEVAKERNFAISTIEGHLANYVANGEIEVTDFVPQKKLNKILQYISENPTKSMGEMKYHLGEEVTFSDLRFVMKHLESKENIL